MQKRNKQIDATEDKTDQGSPNKEDTRARGKILVMTTPRVLDFVFMMATGGKSQEVGRQEGIRTQVRVQVSRPQVGLGG